MGLKEANEKTSQQKFLTWIIIVFAVALVIIAGLSYYLVFIYPENQVSQFGITNITEKANIVNQYRTTSIQLISTFAQIFGGIAVLIGIYFAWGNLKVSQATLESNQINAEKNLEVALANLKSDQETAQKNLEVALANLKSDQETAQKNIEISLATLDSNIKNAQKNLEVAQEGQVTERFTRAVDQLGSEKIETRLGAIYALERVANESDKDYWPIMEILTNFVRINSPVKDWDNEIQELKSPRSEYINDEYKVRVDIQAVINVIGRRRYFFGAKEQKPLYLRHTYLRMISLYDALNGAHLIGADLNGAHLERAFLDFSDLIGATFTGAYLEKIYFIKSCLNFAQFDYARLKGAHLERCCLKIANFSNADLSDADLSDADLSDADLSDANLERANLKGAKNLTIEQLSSVKTLYKAKLDEELEKPLREKYPALFDEPIR